MDGARCPEPAEGPGVLPFVWRAPLPRSLSFIPPMMPTLIDKPPVRGEWAVEVKWDGWRCQIIIDSEVVRIFTRRGHDWTKKLRIIADAAASELKVKSAIIDGELVYPHDSGRSDFAALQAVVRSHSDRLIFMAFDILHHNGEDTRRMPLEERRERLQALIGAGGRIHNTARHWRVPLRRSLPLLKGWTSKASFASAEGRSIGAGMPSTG